MSSAADERYAHRASFEIVPTALPASPNRATRFTAFNSSLLSRQRSGSGPGKESRSADFRKKAGTSSGSGRGNTVDVAITFLAPGASRRRKNTSEA
jgi:hypothetical protein